MKHLLTLLMIVYLYVSAPVSSLQFDLDTQGSVTGLVYSKDVAVNRLPNGLLRVVLSRLNQTEFQGRFASVSNEVLAISGVVGARADGSDAHITVTKVSQTQGATVNVEP